MHEKRLFRAAGWAAISSAVVNLLSLPDQPDLHRQCIQNITTLRAACDVAGMPLMVEPLVMKDGYGVDGDPEKIVPIVRQNALAILCPNAQKEYVDRLIKTFDRPGRATMVFGNENGAWLCTHSHMSLNRGVPQQSFANRPVKSR